MQPLVILMTSLSTGQAPAVDWAFLLTYTLSRSDAPVAIADDWDLDAALQQCKTSLRLSVHCSSHFDVTYTGSLCPGELTPTPSRSEIVRRDNSPSLLTRLLRKIHKLLPFRKRQHPDALDAESHWSCYKPPMTFGEFQMFVDTDGRMVCGQAFRESIYRGGVSPKLRKMVWRHLLNVFPEGLTSQERIEYLKSKSQEYYDLKSRWKSVYKQTPMENLSEEMRFVTTMVKKDVTRCDRTHRYYKGKEDNKHIVSLFDILCTYSLNHTDVSYCQGMCDFASPLLVVQDNEANAYLLFCALMERVGSNFSFNGKAISTKFEHLTQLLSYFDKDFFSYMQENQADNLLFAYRWILLEMKREFPFEDSLSFMEVMWSTIPTMPRQYEVALYDTKSEHRLTCTNPMLFLSPFSKLNSLSDTDSMSQFSDSELLSIDTSIADRELTLDQAISLSEAESIDIDDDESRLRIGGSSSQTTVCHCYDELELEAASRSTFYIELSEADYYFLTGQMPSDNLHKCNCSNSVDSGFTSRPDSPSRQHEQSSLEDSIEAQSCLFPPPQEMGFGNPFLIFAALTMILQHRDEIMDCSMDFNDILMLFNNSMRKHDAKAILQETRLLYEAYIHNDLQVDVDEFEHL